jgi:hypothetical protein
MAVLTPSSLVNQSLASADDIVVVIERLHQHQQKSSGERGILVRAGIASARISIHPSPVDEDVPPPCP